MNLSPHFTRREFSCHCGCGFDDVDPRLIDGLETLRSALGARPVIVNSGCRCKAHNAAQPKSSANSQHILGKAADIVVRGVSPEIVASVAKNIAVFAEGGIGIYDTFTHVDVRKGRGRWDWRTRR
jgi:uncharacterized protein YcbK (DUF882 family)